jgi:hypothetical protein
MEDQHAEPKYPIRGLLGMLALLFLYQCIHNWHAFHDQGLRAGLETVRWDNFFAMTVGAIVGWLMRQPKEITTLGIGEATARKLR